MKLDREKVIVAAMALALVWYFKDLILTWGENSVSPVVSRSAPLLSLNETVAIDNLEELIEIELPVSVALGPKDCGKDFF